MPDKAKMKNEKSGLNSAELSALFESSLSRIILLTCRAVRNDAGEIGDWLLLATDAADAANAPAGEQPLAGLNLIELFGTEKPLPAIIEQARTTLTTGKTSRFETCSPWNGKSFSMAMVPSGPDQLFLAAVDVTDQQARDEALLALRQADRQKDEFLAMLAHELRNPLGPIRNAVHMLGLTGSQDPFFQRQRNLIERQVAHISRLLDDLLDVSRITRGQISLKKSFLNVADILSQAVEIADPLLSYRRQSLRFTPPPAGLRVEGDFDRLVQVVGNLLTNASKFTPEGGRIWLEADQEDKTAVIRVRDTGIGITPEALPHVFDLFVRADHSPEQNRGGLGIGLTIVRSIVLMHGGTVEARSAGLGKGSDFSVRLPALPKIPSKLQVQFGGLETQPSGQKRILIVDDVTDAADSLAEIIRFWGYEARTAYSGTGAVEIASAFRPDVILLDIGLPGMNGYEVAKHFLDSFGNAVEIIALTGYGRDADLENTRQAGFRRHLVKPVNLHELQRLLQEN
jgi:signal transduction histidine kinase